MKNELRNPNEILSRHVSGFHQYCLTGAARPVYVSENLCRMLGVSEADLLSPTEDRYARLVHPADRQRYCDFLAELGREAQTRTLEYRLVKPDGMVLHVSGTMTSCRDGGVMLGNAVLTDITALKSENENLRFLSETMPCGFLKYTCEKNPRITYINDRMKEFLGFPDAGQAGFDHLELYKQNIFLMIPPEERRRFSVYLDRVYQHGAPIAGEMTVQRFDGTRAYLFGWVTKSVNAEGAEEFQSACMDVTERRNLKKERQTRRYLKALTEVYDKIFEYDLSARTVRCLYGQNSPMFQWIENVPMGMEDATEKWIGATVCEEDRDRVLEFFRAFCRGSLAESDTRPPQIRYRALSSDGKMRGYTGIFLKTDANVSLYCCRRTPAPETADGGQDYEALKSMVMRFTEGVVAFEVENGMVRPLYTSDNVRSFFGYTREQWTAMAQTGQSIRDFISQSGIAYEDVRKLFATGEAEFTYFDMTQNAYRRIKAICSQKDAGGSPKFYVMLYNVDSKAAQEPDHPGKEVRIRTFGYFDVFVDGRPIAFRNEKSKELFALLVDRRGGFITSEEAIGFLWEDEPANAVTLARYRKVALRLKNILEEHGIADIVESVNGKRRLAAEKVQCDLYDYLSGKQEFAQLFKGSYLTNYSWGENTLAELTGEHFFA